MIKAAVIYWLALNILNLVGGLIGWFQLKQSSQRVSHYLSRILMAEALRSLFSIMVIQRYRAGLVASPYLMCISTVVITLMCGAIWGWLAYTHGVINGGGWWELFNRRRRWLSSRRYAVAQKQGEIEMEDREPLEDNEDEQNESNAPADAGNAGGGAPASPADGSQEPGVGEGPGK